MNTNEKIAWPRAAFQSAFNVLEFDSPELKQAVWCNVARRLGNLKWVETGGKLGFSKDALKGTSNLETAGKGLDVQAECFYQAVKKYDDLLRGAPFRVIDANGRFARNTDIKFTVDQLPWQAQDLVAIVKQEVKEKAAEVAAAAAQDQSMPTV